MTTVLTVAEQAAARLAAFTAEARDYLKAGEAAIQAESDSAKYVKDRLDNAKDSLRNNLRDTRGFRAVRFRQAADLGDIFDKHYPRDNHNARPADARDALPGIIASWWNAQKMTEKSEKGGNMAAARTLISAGRDCRRILNRVQNRIDAWNDRIDSAEGEGKADVIAEASRYVSPATTKHNGRPECDSGHGFTIQAQKSTTRLSQIADIVRTWELHGEDALTPRVIDAMLDNGGKVGPDVSLKALATKAMEALAKVREHTAESPDDVAFNLAFNVLARVAETGEATAPAGPRIMVPMSAAETREAEQAERDADSAESSGTGEAASEGSGEAETTKAPEGGEGEAAKPAGRRRGSMAA